MGSLLLHIAALAVCVGALAAWGGTLGPFTDRWSAPWRDAGAGAVIGIGLALQVALPCGLAIRLARGRRRQGLPGHGARILASMLLVFGMGGLVAHGTVFSRLRGADPIAWRWLPARVLRIGAAGSVAATARSRSSPGASDTSGVATIASRSRPEPAALAAFEAHWETWGRAQAKRRPWLAARRVAIRVDAGVDDAVGPKVQAALRELLEQMGGGLAVETPEAAPAGLSSCIRDGVLDPAGFRTALADIRARDPILAGAIVVFVTDAALGRRHEDLGGGRSVGPPAGIGSSDGGYAIVSEYYRRMREREANALAAPHVARDDQRRRFLDHGRATTTQHELVHILGLAHHPEIPNPGFDEPPEGNRCRHRIGGPPRAECLMRCGAGDDDWFHTETFGRGFGLCDKCRCAATAALRGVRET